MNEPFWISREVILSTQEELLERFGGLAGIRDETLLESALHRPQHLFAYGKPTLFELATAYAAGIVKNHPFLDGNKRAVAGISRDPGDGDLPSGLPAPQPDDHGKAQGLGGHAARARKAREKDLREATGIFHESRRLSGCADADFWEIFRLPAFGVVLG